MENVSHHKRFHESWDCIRKFTRQIKSCGGVCNKKLFLIFVCAASAYDKAWRMRSYAKSFNFDIAPRTDLFLMLSHLDSWCVASCNRLTCGVWLKKITKQEGGMKWDFNVCDKDIPSKNKANGTKETARIFISYLWILINDWYGSPNFGFRFWCHDDLIPIDWRSHNWLFINKWTRHGTTDAS